MFESIEIKKYRSIKSLKIENLKQFNLVVGSTNIGKTTLLEGIFLTVNPDNMNLILSLNSFRKIPYQTKSFLINLFYELDPVNIIEIKAITKERENNIRDLKYSAILNQDNSFSLTDESLSSTASPDALKIDHLLLTINEQQEYLLTLRPLGELERAGNVLLDPFKKELKKGNAYKMTFNGRFEHISAFAGAFSGKYDILVENNEKEEFLSLIHKIDPNIKKIEKTDKDILIDYGFKKPIPIGSLGNGMIKVLNIIAAIFCTKNGIVLIDELENGMHYELLDILWDAIYHTASKFKVQIIATTHSYDCIRAFYNKSQNYEIRLLRLEKENDIHESINYNKEDIKVLIEEDMEVR